MAESPILPVPKPVIDHHGETLFAPMKEWVAQKRVPPVLLLTGTTGTGKRQIGWYLAQWILCERSGLSTAPAGEESPLFGGADLFGGAPAAPATSPGSSSDEPRPCGECPACQRALQQNWVDFKEILPEDEGGTLKIDQFRELKGSLGFGAHEGRFRITLIPNADRMTPQAANSLLKLLEEPPPGWLFFLTASDPTLILPTVLSRCQTIRLKPFDRKTVETLLAAEGIDHTRASICAQLCHGSWNRALYLANEEAWEKRKILFSFLKRPSEQTNALLDWAAQEPSHFDLLVDQLETLVADLVQFSLAPASQVGNPASFPWANTDGREALVTQVQNATRAFGNLENARTFWIERAERLAQARQEALTPVNRKLLIQDLLLPWVRTQVRN